MHRFYQINLNKQKIAVKLMKFSKLNSYIILMKQYNINLSQKPNSFKQVRQRQTSKEVSSRPGFVVIPVGI